MSEQRIRVKGVSNTSAFVACGGSLRFQKPLRRRKVVIRQRYRDRAHGRMLATETVDFENGGGAIGCQDLRLGDFEMRVRLVLRQSA